MRFGILTIPTQNLEKLAQNARLAEDKNFDFFWVSEEGSHLTFFRDLFVSLSVIAVNTHRIIIGPGTTNPYLRHPAVTANAIATLDEFSNGRAAIMMGAGQMGTYGLKQFGIEREIKPITAVKEAIEIYRGILSGKPFNYEGNRFIIKNATLTYKPRPDIPIILAARGPKMMELAGKIADGVCIDFAPAEYVPIAKKHLEKGLAQRERKVSNYIFSINPMVSISKNREEAREAVKKMIFMPISVCVRFKPILDSLGLTKEDLAPAIEEGIKPSVNYTKILKREVVDTLIDRCTLCGTVDDVIDRVRQYEKAGANQIDLLPADIDFMKTDLAKYIKIIGEEPIPHFKS
jgi:5,10-methylenetetrahydromethanopterin reductase